MKHLKFKLLITIIKTWKIANVVVNNSLNFYLIFSVTKIGKFNASSNT